MNLEPFVINDFRDNFLSKYESMYIEASAGTGKTFTIMNMVSEMLKKKIPLEKLLLVTFTDKATGELKDRIRKKISDEINSNTLDSEQLEFFKESLSHIDSASIYTFHSFCKSIINEFAFEACSNFDLGMVDDGDAVVFLDKYLRDDWVKNQEFLSLYNNDRGVIDTLFDRIFRGAKNFRGYDSNDEPIVPLEELPENVEFEFPFNEDINISKNEVDDLVKEYEKMNGINLDVLRKIKIIDDNISFLEANADVGFVGVSGNKHFRKHVSDLLDFFEEWKGNTFVNGSKFGSVLESCEDDDVYEILEFFYENKEVFKSIINNITNKFYKTKKELEINKFVAKQIPVLWNDWNQYKTSHKIQSFDDMILSVYKLANKNSSSDFLSKLQEKYTYAIIDEFQDTNMFQWGIFKNIFHNVKNHAIYVVGDPKQAIYKFQGADIDVYREAISTIGNGRSLLTNYRSTNKMIEACNKIFSAPQYFDSGSKINFNDSQIPDSNFEKLNPTFNGTEIPPVWIAEKNATEYSYANWVVSNIVEWCSKENGKTNLQVFDKNLNKMRNVNFSDFSILAQARFQMIPFENAMKNAGIPFKRYKDSNLFEGRECSDWIMLFRAIDCPDFSYSNKRILNDALISDFFRIDIDEVESSRFENPEDEIIEKFSRWRKLASEKKYSQLIERIYEDTDIEDFMTDLSKLQNLAKIHQIGNYSLEYLYGHSNGLSDLIRHLDSLKNDSSETMDEDGNLVAKDTDFDAVQLMTIHASKGLEFPIVISAGGTWANISQKVPFLFRNNNQLQIGFTSDAKEIDSVEMKIELKRLFYVDYTRATSVLFLPQYEKDGLEFVRESLEYFIDNSSPEMYSLMPSPSDDNSNDRSNDTDDKIDLRKIVREKILCNNNSKNNSLDEKTNDELKAQQYESIKELKAAIKNRFIQQPSYSSLTGKYEPENYTDGNENTNKNGTEESIKPKGFDETPVRIIGDEYSSTPNDFHEKKFGFPRGSSIGNVLHGIMEKFDYSSINKYDDAKELSKDSKFVELAIQCFVNEAFSIDRHPEWIEISANYIFNTLNAKFPEIKGAEKTGREFYLNEIPERSKKTEMRFNYTGNTFNNPVEHGEPLNDIPLEAMFIGFMDLLFVRKDESNNDIYSILDWKSNLIEKNDSLYDYDTVLEAVDNKYSVQRVLYSYCLIKWLKQFYPQKTEEEIFEQHFGGVYFVFLRGTKKNFSNGIYAQTWNNFAHLKAEYEKLKTMLK